MCKIEPKIMYLLTNGVDYKYANPSMRLVKHLLKTIMTLMRCFHSKLTSYVLNVVFSFVINHFVVETELIGFGSLILQNLRELVGI